MVRAEEGLLDDSTRVRQIRVLKAAAETQSHGKICWCDCAVDHKPERQLLLLSCHCRGKLTTTKVCACAGIIKINLSIWSVPTHTADFPHRSKEEQGKSGIHQLMCHTLTERTSSTVVVISSSRLLLLLQACHVL